MREPGSRRLCWKERGGIWTTTWAKRSRERQRTIVWAALKGGSDGWWETWTPDGVRYDGSW